MCYDVNEQDDRGWGKNRGKIAKKLRTAKNESKHDDLVAFYDLRPKRIAQLSQMA